MKAEARLLAAMRTFLEIGSVQYMQICIRSDLINLRINCIGTSVELSQLSEMTEKFTSLPVMQLIQLVDTTNTFINIKHVRISWQKLWLFLIDSCLIASQLLHSCTWFVLDHKVQVLVQSYLCLWPGYLFLHVYLQFLTCSCYCGVDTCTSLLTGFFTTNINPFNASCSRLLLFEGFRAILV